MKRIFIVAIAAALASASCGEVARTGRAPVILVVNNLEGSPGGVDDFSTFLQSDAQTNGGIVNDVGRATLSTALKNPGTVTAPLGPTQLNSVTLTRYRVRFIRADGRNTPGVDVPWGFDGALTATIPPNGTATFGFELVRHQMKLEPPVSTLRNTGGVAFIHTIAEVTFFGRDLAGNDIEATGTLTVSFADFADPE
jgi:hypothetical protein